MLLNMLLHKVFESRRRLLRLTDFALRHLRFGEPKCSSMLHQRICNEFFHLDVFWRR